MNGQPGACNLCPQPFAFIARTNAMLFHTCKHLIDQGCHVWFLGGLETYKTNVYRDLCYLAKNQKDLIESKFVRRFRSLHTLTQFANNSNDVEWLAKVSLVEEVGAGALLTLLDRLPQHTVANMAEAHVILGTVHKAKGLEFDRVVLADDFADLEDLTHNEDAAQLTDEDVNLLYVAVTRAKTELYINKGLSLYLQSKRVYDAYWAGIPIPSDPFLLCDDCGDYPCLDIGHETEYQVLIDDGGYMCGNPPRATLSRCRRCLREKQDRMSCLMVGTSHTPTDN